MNHKIEIELIDGVARVRLDYELPNGCSVALLGRMDDEHVSVVGVTAGTEVRALVSGLESAARYFEGVRAAVFNLPIPEVE